MAFHPADLELSNNNIEIKCGVENYFKTFYINTITSQSVNSILVGLNTGIMKQYSLVTLMKTKTYNPFEFDSIQITAKSKSTASLVNNPSNLSDRDSNLTDRDSNLSDRGSNLSDRDLNLGLISSTIHFNEIKKRIVSVENAFISGIESIVYGNLSELIFVNHKLSFTNCLNRNLTLDEAPIFLYKTNGNALKKLTGMKGDILSAGVMENRNLYMALSSNQNQLYVWNYLNGSLLMKIGLDIVKNQSMPQFFTHMVYHEFEMNQRYLSLEKVFSMMKPEKKEKKLISAQSRRTISSPNPGKYVITRKDFESSPEYDKDQNTNKLDDNTIATPTSFTTSSTLENSLNLNSIQSSPIDKKKQDQNVTVDGDILFSVGSNGAVLISKLNYENEKGSILWTPLKFLNTKETETVNNIKSSIKKNIDSKFISCMVYNKYQDKLYFADQDGNIRIFSNMVKNSLTIT